MADGLEHAVEFLKREGALRIGESPWLSFDESDNELHLISWEQLFPRRSGDRTEQDYWNPEIGGDFLSELQEAVGRRPTEPLSDSGGSLRVQFDTCAWYQPVHFFGYDWGIYIKEDCVTRLAVNVARFLDPGSFPAQMVSQWVKPLLRGAIYCLFLHEQYHHKVECLGFRLHVVRQQSSYLPYKDAVYVPTFGTDDNLEEALANAHSWRRLGDEPYRRWLRAPVVGAAPVVGGSLESVVDAFRDYLQWSFPGDPPGYRRAVAYLNKPSFDSGENRLQGQVKEAVLGPTQSADDWESAPRLLQSFLPVTSNIWTIIRPGSRSIFPLARGIASAPTCSTKDMIRLYEQQGYQVTPGGKGSHVKLAKPGAPTMILPGNRRDLRPRTLRTALTVLGSYRLHDLPRLLAGKAPV